MIGGLLGLAGLAVIAATAASYASDWRLALLAHFRPQLAVSALVLALLVIAVGTPHRLILGPVLLAVSTLNFSAMRHALPRLRPVIADDAPRLRIAFANLFVHNKQYRRMIDWVRAEKPDLFVACEAYGGWPGEMSALAELYPFATHKPFGDILIFSRWPPVSVHHVLEGWNGHAVMLEIESALGPLAIIVLHTMSPLHENPCPGGYNLIADLGELIAKRDSDFGGDLVVLGDFNATPWSRPMRRLVERTGLAYGPGSWRGSFPAWLPTWMAMPIDLALARGDWHVAARRLGPRLGSDHWPVIFEVVRLEGPGSARLDPSHPHP